MKRKQIGLATGMAIVMTAASVVPSGVAEACYKCVQRHQPVEVSPYQQMVNKVARMVYDQEARRLAGEHGLNILNVMWEDTGRWKGSSFGPNISDVTIEVVSGEGGGRRMALMPVIRYPNFSDKTSDIRLDKFFIKVGNERTGRKARVVSLKQFLEHPLRYMSLPEKGTIKGGTLLAERDTHALVSAQSAFLPVPASGKATFHPVIFNYQSTKNNPAVLTILVTRQGTSMTIVDNSRDRIVGSWGQRLYFNKKGERAPLIAERLSHVKSTGKTANNEAASSLGDDSNLLMLVQVPLKYNAPRRVYGYGGSADMAAPSGIGVYKLKSAAKPAAPMAKAESGAMARMPSTMETAVLGHGPTDGPYAELSGLTIERDQRFPVRVTVQFYQAISDANVGEANMAALASQISKVYAKGDYIGSLVVGDPNADRRPTAWTGIKEKPEVTTVCDFPGLVEQYEKLGWTLPCKMTVGIH
ncbi:MAG: hypothetical protein HYY84_10120 [Deltaproteobacteria bacterium]|nr:hypothetical protein [Deltaproteobacteria bacterium]